MEGAIYPYRRLVQAMVLRACLDVESIKARRQREKDKWKAREYRDRGIAMAGNYNEIASFLHSRWYDRSCEFGRINGPLIRRKTMEQMPREIVSDWKRRGDEASIDG
jgi:hypothetical protein